MVRRQPSSVRKRHTLHKTANSQIETAAKSAARKKTFDKLGLTNVELHCLQMSLDSSSKMVKSLDLASIEIQVLREVSHQTFWGGHAI
jgi:hypothetical protein